MPNEVYRVNMSILREKFLTGYANGECSELSAANNALAKRYAISKTSNSWTGAGSAEFANYLENGYESSNVPAFDTSTIPVRKRKRARYNDCEGDFRYDIYSSGDENCFVEWTKRESIPGVHVQFFFGFRGNVEESTIRQYTDWLLGAFTTLEAAGVDCSISAYNRGRSRYARSNNGYEMSEFHVEVKREGERNDFTNWSALFAPGAYRLLGFFCIILMAEFNGRTASSNMGSSSGEGWDIKFNPETRVIEISADSGGYDFPEAKMTEKLGEAIAATRG